jgi:predicted MFS family arabinose efflux permease
LVYAGITIGSLLASAIFSKSNLIKPVLFLSLLLNAVSLVVFALSENFYLDATLRLFIGIFQVFVTIYMPVWADIFAKESRKSAWLTFLILAAPLGLVIGFALTSALIPHFGW